MAIGDSYSATSGNSNFQGNNGNGNRSSGYDPTYYSRFRLVNKEKRLNINYRAGLLIIQITNNDINNQDRFSTNGAIFLSPTKASLLVHEIDAFLDYRDPKKDNIIDPNKAFGVCGGMNEKVSYIGFHTNDARTIFVTIGKFDGNGTITESDTFEFTYDYNYSLEWDNITSNKLTKVYNNEVDITMLRNTIADFARYMPGSLAYSVHDLNRYEKNKDNRRMDQVFDKLGIERYNSRSNYGATNNFLSNATSSSNNHTTIDELEEDLLS